MKKKIITKKKFTSSTTNKCLSVGQAVLYMTPYTLDKTEVVSINKKENSATLSNQIKVLNSISIDGYLIRLTPQIKSVNVDKSYIRVWSDEAESEYNYHVARKLIPTHIKSLSDVLVDLPKESVIKLEAKLKKLVSKYV